jgi:GntR family transcriptional regulator
MEDIPLYQKIVESIRKQILIGQLQPGDRLPSVRQMTEEWDCTPGTVQRAYRELARQGLIVSRAGQGTHVIKAPHTEGNAALRRAHLVHRSRSFYWKP